MISSKILVIGEQGQLARSLNWVGLEAIYAGRKECDLLNPKKIETYLNKIQPSLVINTAAYTDVNKAGEVDQRDSCKTLNAESPSILAAWCYENQAQFIHFSTDYVYQDKGVLPYAEESLKGPLNFYAETKLQGEGLILRENPDAWIFRVSWLYSSWGVNFLKKILELSKTKTELSVVDDQVGTPTSTLFLAKELVAILPYILSGKMNTQPKLLERVFNLSGNQYQSWYDFTVDILNCSAEMGMVKSIPRINKVSSSEFPSPVKRPLNSRLNCKKYETFFGRSLTRDLKQDLREVLNLIKG